MSKELNCMNCSIGDFKHELCDCDNGFCKEFKSIGTQEDFFNAVIQRIRPQDDWIPVSERLPEDGYWLWSATSGEVKKDFYWQGHWELAEKFGYEVVAWMPLPEPYKGGDTE